MKRLLFVDDEPFFSRPYVSALSDTGWTVDVCTSVDDAIRHLAEHAPYDAVILDVMMPPPEGIDPAETDGGLDSGIWLLERITESHALSESTPVILLSNRAQEYVVRRCQSIPRASGTFTIRAKFDTPPYALPRILDSMMRSTGGES